MKVLVTGGSGFIGTNLIQHLSERGHEVRSLDKRPPKNSKHSRFFTRCDILDADSLTKVVTEFSPHQIVHLAARTDMDENKSIAGYAANVAGVANMIRACARLPKLERVAFASTMLVCRQGYVPQHDTDYCPSTVYGESKVAGEKLVRENKELAGRWTLIRPASTWGPWFEAPYRAFFLAIARNRYFHPGSHRRPKPLAYVGNTIYQIEKLLEAPPARVDGKTFQLGDDPPYSIREWAEIIQDVLGARPIREIPLWAFRGAAVLGDTAKVLGWKHPPMTSFRLNNMLTGTTFNLQELRAITGSLPFSLTDGVTHTAEWLRGAGLI